MECNDLFVYGTLRKGTSSEMYRILAREADFVADATFHGRLYMIDYYPGVVPSANQEDVVHGELYHMLNPTSVLQKLDVYEECGEGFSLPQEYVRQIVDVMLPSGKMCKAWTYIYNRPVHNLKRIISGDFLDIAQDPK